MPRHSERGRFRKYALDGAALYFHPDTGTQVRVQCGATRVLARRAPRVVMFGLTNACNFSCSYCSRNPGRDSAWTVASAAEVLRGLSERGVLEVAFGGGEPFAFRGFAELVAELFETTPLALHVTSNGSLIREPAWRAYAGRFGQVRLSLHDDGAAFRNAARVLGGAGQLFGANVLTDDSLLPSLPALLAELAELGCHDVSLLRYVGPDPRRHLSRRGLEQLSAIAGAAPLACRVSVCFGERLDVPRLFDGADDSGDCGAGYDFITVTSDQKVQGCSFQENGLDARSAEDVLHAWQLGRARFSQPAWRKGCARREHAARRVSARGQPSLAVWQAFSGNNSGECVMVAKFESVADAEGYLSKLVPGWSPDEPYSAEWRRLFRDEGVATPRPPREHDHDDGSVMPRELVAVANTVLALAGHAEDAFPELRALAWRHGAHVLNGIHVHDDLSVLAAVRARDGDDAQSLMQALDRPAVRSYRHGDAVLLTTPLGGTLEGQRDLLRELAGERPHAAELFFEPVDDAALVAVKQRLGHELDARPRLSVSYYGPDADDRAARFARLIQGDSGARVASAGGCVLIEGVTRRKRLALLGYRHDGLVDAHEALDLRLSASFWYERPTRQRGEKASPRWVDRLVLDNGLRRRLPPGATFELEAARYGHALSATMTTPEPLAALQAFAECAEELECRVNVWLGDTQQLAFAVRRLLSDVR